MAELDGEGSMGAGSELPFEKVVLPVGVSESDCEDFAEGHFFFLAREQSEDEEAMRPRALTFQHQLWDTACVFAFNFKLQFWTVECFGTDRAKAADLVRAYFETVDESVIRLDAGSVDPATRANAMAYLGEFCTETYEPSLLGLFEAGSMDDDPDVREATFLAMGFLNWEEFLPIVEKARKTETDEYLIEQLERRKRQILTREP